MTTANTTAKDNAATKKEAEKRKSAFVLFAQII